LIAMHTSLFASILTSTGFTTGIAALAGCLIVYLAYKFFYRPDFGMPVRRRILAKHIRFRRDQVADVPVWWTNLQVQRAVRGHWKQSLRDTVMRPRELAAELQGHGAEMTVRAALTAGWPRVGR
jgi:uncharacterized membrane protein YcfT